MLPLRKIEGYTRTALVWTVSPAQAQKLAQRRLARAEEAAQDGDGQWSLAGLLHGRGRGLDGFEQVRVLTFLLLCAVVRAVRVAVAMGRHFGSSTRGDDAYLGVGCAVLVCSP